MVMASKRKRDVVESVMHHRSIMLLVIGSLLALGVYALINMPKNEFPEFTVRQGVIIGVYPGATAEEVEARLTQPLEKFLWEFSEIKKADTYSQSQNGMSVIFVELNDNLDNKEEFWSKFKLRIEQYRSSLPQGVLALVVNDDFGDTSAMLVTMSGRNKTYKQLHYFMEQLQDSLRQVPEVAKLSVSGELREQIGVYIDTDRLAKYGINVTSLLSQLSSRGMVVASGSVDDNHTKRPIVISAEIATEYDVAEQIVYSDVAGNVVRLRDVADVRREYPTNANHVKDNGANALVLSVEMKSGNNVVAFGNTVRSIIGNFQKTLPADITITPITDQGKVVNESIMTFLEELLIAIASVILVIMILLPMRVAAVAASTIPVTIFISLGIFYALGIELNTVTLAALIVMLGMIVDDSVVIIDAYIEYVDEGLSRWHAAGRSVKEFFQSILTATLAISVTFFPLLITMTGTMYDFVKWFPYAVTVILFTSLAMAVFLVPVLLFAFIRKGIKKEGNKAQRKSMLDYMQRWYNVLIFQCFKHPFITVAVGAVSIVVGAFFLAAQPQRLMPYADRDQFAVEIYLPQGASLAQTAAVADSMQSILRSDSRVREVTAFYGSGSPRFQTSYAPEIGGTNFAQFIVNTEGNKATIEMLDEYSSAYEAYFPNAKIRFKQLDYSKAKSPVEFRFTGGTIGQLKAVADSAQMLMRANPKLMLVRSSFEGTEPAVRVDLDTDEATRLGMSKSLVSLNLAVQFGAGVPLTTVWEDDYPVSVVLKSHNAAHQTPTDVEAATLLSPLPGISVPLRQISSISPTWETSRIQRRNGVREVSVTAEMVRGYNLNRVIDETNDILSESLNLPEGVSMTIGGQRYEDNQTQPQILGGLAISVVVIFAILLFHFRNIRLSLIVMAALLFSLLGAATGIWSMGQSISITGILGIISLMGIIVRNSIIMIDYAEELRLQHRLSAKHAAIQAAMRRMRPIFLTSAAASMGVIPMVIANTPMWGPMGSVVCIGTLVCMLFILTMVPVAYWLIFRLADKRRILKDEKKRANIMQNKITTAVATALLLTLALPTTQAQTILTIEQCRHAAVANNVRLKTDSLQLLSANETKREARTHYYPTVSASATYFHSADPLVRKDITISAETSSTLAQTLTAMGLDASVLASLPTSYSLGLLDRGLLASVMAMQPIYTGGALTSANRLAEINTQVRQLMLAQSREELLLATDEYYYKLLSLYSHISTLDATDSMLAGIHRDALNAYHAGVRNKSDVLNVELKQHEVASSRLKVENGISLVKMLLAHHIGLSAEAFDIDRSIATTPSPPDTYLVNHAAAVETLTTTLLLDKSVEAARQEVKSARSKLMPTVGVGVAGSYTNIDGGLISKFDVIGMANVSVPISQWWTSSHTVKRKRMAETEARLNRDDKRELLMIDMQSKFNDLTQAYKQIAIAQKSEEAATENLRLRHDYYRAGIGTMSELLEAQARLTTSLDSRTEALTTYLTALTAYMNSTGRLK